ncbi:MAG: polyphosphate kinase 1 [Candidatus Omnitrophica bacterium]|nr:polyphosphate kinase 1 [Candidatus Omnitrophota bacterium]
MSDLTTKKSDETRFFDRELSWIQFNERVFNEAADETNPLLERLKFAGIVSSNFDEFFMVRIASLSEESPMAAEAYSAAFDLMKRLHQYCGETLMPALKTAGIERVYPHSLSAKQREYLDRFYTHEILPLLTPVAVRAETGMPALVNLSLYQLVQLVKENEPQNKHYAVIEIPKVHPRCISLPSETAGMAYILIEDILGLYVKDLFQGYAVTAKALLRMTRAADLSLNEERDEDFSKVMTEMLRMRRKSAVVRLELSGPVDVTDFFMPLTEVAPEKIFRCDDWLDLKSISQLAFQSGFENLKRPVWTPRSLQEFDNPAEIWTALRERDVLAHHPYDSFDAFLKFLKAAVNDPEVLAIKQTLYRIAIPSAVLEQLETAAERGKQVTVLVELKARFEEKRNIEWAERLINAGATVLYGVAGYKTHAKACLVIRREAEGIRRYLHLSTGNYNENTARLYTDLALFTSDDTMGAEVASFFNLVTGLSEPVGFSKIEIAPYGLKRRLQRLIVREAIRSQRERKGLIIAKMNSLVDRDIIETLYHASQAGVKIKLNVRGICCLKPGVKGMSENIEVVSIVDRFLEHSRIFYFYNEGEEDLYLSSADWMPRNLMRRLELMFPVEDSRLKRQIIQILENGFKDNIKGSWLQPDGTYRKLSEEERKKPFRLQEYLCEQTLSQEKDEKRRLPNELKPQRPSKELLSSSVKDEPEQK